MDWCIGNGQVHQLCLSKLARALNCMHDQQAILRGGRNVNSSPDNQKGGDDMEMVGSAVRRLTPL